MSDLLAIVGAFDADDQLLDEIERRHPDRVTVLVEEGDAPDAHCATGSRRYCVRSRSEPEPSSSASREVVTSYVAGASTALSAAALRPPRSLPSRNLRPPTGR